MMEDSIKAKLIKDALLIVDKLGKIDEEDINDVDVKEELEELIIEAKKLKKNKFWRL